MKLTLEKMMENMIYIIKYSDGDIYGAVTDISRKEVSDAASLVRVALSTAGGDAEAAATLLDLPPSGDERTDFGELLYEYLLKKGALEVDITIVGENYHAA